MQKIGRNDACPCGSGNKFKKCCAPAVEGGGWPASPEALMRSRYTAFVIGDPEYLFRTTHPDNDQLQGSTKEKYLTDTLSYCRKVDFIGLEVKGTWAPDERGIAKVLFTAKYRLAGQEDLFTELSEFVQVDGHWLYLNGVEDPPEELQA